MKVEVRLFATLERYLPAGAQGDSAVMAFPDGATVGQVVDALRIPPHVPFMAVVNGHEAEVEQMLVDGDVLTMFPPLAGGSAHATTDRPAPLEKRWGRLGGERRPAHPPA